MKKVANVSSAVSEFAKGSQGGARAFESTGTSKCGAASVEPKERLKALASYSTSLTIDPHVPPRRYYRSGLEMVRMANVYLDEGNLENAYVLYLKFMTLFLEKIRTHPQFNTVPPNMKTLNQVKIREVLPKTEKLKARLLEQYTKEYNQYCEEKLAAQNEEIHNIIPVPKNTFPEPISSFGADKPTPKPTASNISAPGPTDYAANLSISTGMKFETLRSVIVPSKLIASFLQSAMKNTLYNIETCGILAGDLERDRLVVTHAIIPQQSGTPDSCTTMNEEQIFDYQDTNNLITIGWIHTHPTQTAFLSSVDLHTHCPYQTLLPEAVAIVCAPKFDETGIFQLTPSYGLKYIANCRLSGFHPHPTEPPLFANAEHVKLDRSAKITIVDFRP